MAEAVRERPKNKRKKKKKKEISNYEDEIKEKQEVPAILNENEDCFTNDKQNKYEGKSTIKVEDIVDLERHKDHRATEENENLVDDDKIRHKELNIDKENETNDENKVVEHVPTSLQDLQEKPLCDSDVNNSQQYDQQVSQQKNEEVNDSIKTITETTDIETVAQSLGENETKAEMNVELPETEVTGQIETIDMGDAEHASSQEQVQTPLVVPDIVEAIPTTPDVIEVIPTAPLASLPDVAISNSSELVSVSQMKAPLVPFTDVQLQSFYFNQALFHMEYFIDEFLKNATKEENEFYELVLTYFKARKRFVGILEKIYTLQEKSKSDKTNIWEIKLCSCQAKGVCGCRVQVEQEHRYQQAFYNQTKQAAMSDDLSTLRSLINESCQLECYNCNVTKIRIDDHLVRLLNSPTIVQGLRADDSISASRPEDMSSEHIDVLSSLQDCISVLFIFKRMHALEKQFEEDLDNWLNLLISALLRVGTLPDAFFILNHLLRCPPGTIPKMAAFIQFPSFHENQTLPIFDRPQVDHFIVMLATLTLPVKSRKEFLHKYQQQSNEKPAKRSISWTLVDENKEEEEAHDDNWNFLTEADLISIFEQFPLTDLFQSVLYVQQDQQGKLLYTPSSSNSNDVMRSFAFFSCLVQLLGKIFETYYQIRYRNFTKTVSCHIRVITQVVSDHWLSYRQHRLNVMGDSYEGLPIGESPMLPQFTAERLQIEFDQFFIRAAKIIIDSQSSGAIQFLSSMPFDAISSPSMWVVLELLLHKGISSAGDTQFTESSPAPVLSIDVSPSEGIFLLTALSNMAISRNSSDKDFIEVVAKEILQISFLHPSLHELYTKNGHDMLISLSLNHPFIISTLLKYTDRHLKELNQRLVYIFEDLHISKWRPSTVDMEILRTYLLDSLFTSEENKLARSILPKLNYGFKNGTKKLFLPRHMHSLIAILIVETYGLSFPDYPGGIQKLDYAGIGIIGQVSKLALSSYSKIVYHQVHSEFVSWAWDVMLSLKLHETDIPGDSCEDDILLEGSSDSWVVKTLEQLKHKHSYDFDIDLTQELNNVKIALQSKGLLAAYLAFAMTKYGHFVDMFLAHGIANVVLLAEAHQYEAVFCVIHNLVPMFLNCPEKLAIESFLKILIQVIHIDVDNAGYREKLWQYFVAGTYSKKLSGLIANQIMQANQSNESQAIKLIKFWLTMFGRLPYWPRDFGVLYQLDNLCKIAFLIKNGMNVVADYFYEEFTSLIKSQEKKGLLSSMMSWISTNQIISLLPNLNGDFSYFGFIILLIEMRFEEEIKIWKEMAAEILMFDDRPVEQAYKKALGGIKSLYVPPLNQLSIYRWSMLASLTPKEHPFSPLIWQQFFILFLRKQVHEDGLPTRRGVGMRLFSNTTNSGTLKKMKAQLYSMTSYQQDECERTRSIGNDSASELHEKLAKLYQGFALWLEESRVHDPNLYISSLPDAYMPHLLERIFQGKQDIWYEYLDMRAFREEVEQMVKPWNDASSKATTSVIDSESEVVVKQVGQRILRHLKAPSNRQPPPPVVFLHSPVEEVTYHTLLTRPRLLQDINHDLERFVRYAKTSSSLFASHVALDSEYIELLPDLYDNVTRSIVIGIPCNGKRRRGFVEECQAPAQVQIEIKELYLKQRISNIIDDNRAALDKIIERCTENISTELCVGTVHVENVINKLTTAYQHFNEIQRQQLQGNARRLFYLLAQLIDDDVKRCYPAIQFFSTAIEMLGKGFIADNSTEQIPLIDAILNQEASVMFLAPYFTPMNSLEHFADLYSKIITFLTQEKMTTVFVLLSKFDINVWLSSKPSLQIILEVATHIIDALRIIGSNPNSEGHVVLELYRSHMIAILCSNQQQFFSRFLQSLLNASSQKPISDICWGDLLSSIEYDTTGEEDPLSYAVIKDAIEYMASFFYDHTDRLNFQLDLFYEIWETYSKIINQLLQRLFYSYIQQSVRNLNEYNKDQIFRELWDTILSVYRPWLLPRSSGKIWTLLRSESVLSMVQSFTEVLRLVIDACTKEEQYCVFMNFVWTFYFQAVVPVVCEEQSLELFHSMLATLPWTLYCPTVNELSYILQSHDSYPTAFRFLGSLLSDIDWVSVVASYTSSGNALAVTRLHQHLFKIFVLMAANRIILNSSASKLTYLFTKAKTFNWDTLSLEDIAHACKWYSENCDPSLILQEDSVSWKTLNLFYEVCGFSLASSNGVTDMLASKRNIYIQSIVTILGRISRLKQDGNKFRFVVSVVLQTIEKSVAFNNDSTMNELVLHLCTCLSLFNMLSSSTMNEAMKASIQSHLFNTQCGMLIQAFIQAVPRSIASLQEMVSLLESSIKCHFARLSDEELKNSWHPICNSFVEPDLHKEDFVKEAIKQKAILTLYAYNLRRMSQNYEYAHQFDVFVDAVTWCTKLQPDQERESKLVLLWLQIFNLTKTLLCDSTIKKSRLQQAAKYLIYLSHACHIGGEDKTFTGVLGVIGIGRRSALTKEFRFSAKALNLFILCQLPANAPLRNTAHAPGSIRNNTDAKIQVTGDTQKAFTTFQGLSKVKPYNNLQEEIKWIVDFISDPSMCINDGEQLLKYISKKFFDKENFISAAIL